MIHQFQSFLAAATPAQRCLLVIFINTGYLLAYIVGPSIGFLVDEWRTLLDPTPILITNLIHLGVILIQWGMACYLWPRRFNSNEVPCAFRAVATLVCISFSAVAIVGGNLTYPTYMVIICIIPIGFLLLDLAAVLWGFAVGFCLIMGNEVLVLADILVYAPGYSAQAFNNGHHHVMAELLRTLILYGHYVSYLVFFWLLFDHFQQQREKLLVASRRDGLTGLLNRRVFLARLIDFGRASGGAKTVCVVMLDVDNFKRINDREGHQKGDEVLQQLACCLNQVLAPTGSDIARFGGEEFAILIPDKTLAQAQALVSQIQQEFYAYKFSGVRNLFNVTFSAGLSAGPCTTQLLTEADRLLYEAKAQGRNSIAAQTFCESKQPFLGGTDLTIVADKASADIPGGMLYD